MENTSVETEKTQNLLNSQTEKGKIGNGKSVPLHIHSNFGVLQVFFRTSIENKNLLLINFKRLISDELYEIRFSVMLWNSKLNYD